MLSVEVTSADATVHICMLSRSSQTAMRHTNFKAKEISMRNSPLGLIVIMGDSACNPLQRISSHLSDYQIQRL